MPCGPADSAFPVAYARSADRSFPLTAVRRAPTQASRQVLASRRLRYHAAQARRQTHETCRQSVALRMASINLRTGRSRRG